MEAAVVTADAGMPLFFKVDERVKKVAFAFGFRFVFFSVGFF
jgi:hypothetical protein